jgi:hypothetical protein
MTMIDLFTILPYFVFKIFPQLEDIFDQGIFGLLRLIRLFRLFKADNHIQAVAIFKKLFFEKKEILLNSYLFRFF